jgi:3,4-dihydroxy 2-butanone 4-phosphate synthase/GTP cyclohydrolase II
MRSGHTEAAVDLCRLAGLPPVGVICELVNDDGTVMRGPAGPGLRRAHGLKQVSVADLIAYRQRQETLIERVAAFNVETPGGPARAFTYTLPWDPMQHLAHCLRRHPRRRRCSGSPAPGGRRFRRVRQRRPTQPHHEANGRGKARRHRLPARGIGRRRHQVRGRPAAGGEDHEEAKRRESEWREIGLGAQILKDLGITSINLISSRERHYVGLEGFGIRIARTDIS